MDQETDRHFYWIHIFISYYYSLYPWACGHHQIMKLSAPCNTNIGVELMSIKSTLSTEIWLISIVNKHFIDINCQQTFYWYKLSTNISLISIINKHFIDINRQWTFHWYQPSTNISLILIVNKHFIDINCQQTIHLYQL